VNHYFHENSQERERNEKEPHIIFHIRLHLTLDSTKFQFSCLTHIGKKEDGIACVVCIFHIVNKTYIHLWIAEKLLRLESSFSFRWQNTESMLSFCSQNSHGKKKREIETAFWVKSSFFWYSSHLQSHVRQMTDDHFFQDSIFFLSFFCRWIVSEFLRRLWCIERMMMIKFREWINKLYIFMQDEWWDEGVIQEFSIQPSNENEI
jgi:hypothetical protein